MSVKNCRTRRRSLQGLAALVFLMIILASACSRKIIFTTGLGKNEVFRVGGAVCTVSEMMVYLLDTRSRYESLYGPEVWNVSLEGVSLEENVKENVLAKIAQIKAMSLMAESRGVVLSETENAWVRHAAAEYLTSLGEKEKELLEVKPAAIEQLYREYALADKVYRSIVQDVNPEISDDEARTLTVQHILLKTYTVDGAGNRLDYSGQMAQTVYEKACEIRQMAVETGQDFVELASRYSEDSAIELSFRKGEMEAALEEAAFSLETGEVSEVVRTGAGYHVLKCVSTLNRAQTDLNKLVILEERRREVFGQEYNAFVEELPRQMNTKLWESISLPHEAPVAAVSFLEVYEKYFIR